MFRPRQLSLILRLRLKCDCLLVVLFQTKTSVEMTDEGFLSSEAQNGQRSFGFGRRPSRSRTPFEDRALCINCCHWLKAVEPEIRSHARVNSGLRWSRHESLRSNGQWTGLDRRLPIHGIGLYRRGKTVR